MLRNLRSNLSSLLRYSGLSRPLYKIKNIGQRRILNNEYEKLICTGQLKNWVKVEFFLTLRCNLNCPMCHQGLYRERVYARTTKKELTLEEVKRCVDNLYSFGVRRVWLMGGEIFVRSDIFDILDYFKEKKMLVDIGTNGTLFGEQSIRRLDTYPNIHWIEFSLDGLELTHNRIRQNKDAFSKTKEAIKLINAKKRFSTTVTFVLQKDNIDELRPTIELCQGLGVREFNVTMRMFYPFLDIQTSAEILNLDTEQISVGFGESKQEGYSYDKFKEVIDLIPKLNKGQMRVSLYPAVANEFAGAFWRGEVISALKKPLCAALKLITVDYTGDVLLCGFIKKSFGNLLNTPLGEIMNCEEFNRVRKALLQNRLLPICNRCCALNYIK